MKKKVIVGIASCLLAVGIAGGASAAGTWSAEHTMDIPGSGGKAYGASQGVPNKTKASSDVNAAFYGISKTSILASLGKVVNTSKVARSGNIPISPGYKMTGSTTAAKGYAYNISVQSDSWQSGTDSTRFRWSPDSPN